MFQHAHPKVGEWYKNLSEDQLFEVVAIDEHDGSIEIQCVDGELEEMDQETWQMLKIIEENNECAYLYLIDNEDYEQPEDIQHPISWSGLVDEVDQNGLPIMELYQQDDSYEMP